VREGETRTGNFDVPILVHEEIAQLQIEMEERRLEPMQPIHAQRAVLSDLAT
jgi:hypothetical protein